ncbi:conserved hypothetical protein [Paenibacillus curdlanolyticus YK9]|uniref:Lipoprotein n=1 Tax=Paenibacillus curdlanolyticus YK9 TaxID=717606 RepID=E0IEH3_9BACL|nr:hypothetical protein [Paenibacillus curdlanolyticus]EFM09061.1 conserved hypothetical protein [Paenibacillus curdlanolyticus YK9]
MNKRWSNGLKAATALLLASALLAACGSKNSADTAAANGQQGDYAQQQGQGQGQGQGRQGGFQMAAAPNQPDRQADMMAKIISISGTSVVVQAADLSAMPQRGGNGQGRQAQQGEANGQPPADGQAPQADPNWQPPADGQAPQADPNWQPPADGQAPQGDANGQPPADGQAPQGGGRQMPNLFTGEQQTITIPESAAIYKLVRDDQGTMNYEQIKLADLAADDIVNIWIKTGTKEAEYVSLRGGFGGGFGGGGFGQRRGNGQQGADNGSSNANADGQAVGQ